MSDLGGALHNCSNKSCSQWFSCGFRKVLFWAVCFKVSTHEIIYLFRLFYLYEILLTYVKEEAFFTSLTWLYPAFSGIFVSVLLGDHFISSSDSQTVLVFQSCCYKIPMLWVESTWSISYNVTTTISYSITFITFCTHILLYIRKRQLEKQGADQQQGTLIVSFTGEDVEILRRGPNQPSGLASGQQLWRHSSTVVSSKASFLVFLLRLFLVLPHALYYFKGQSRSVPPLGEQFLIFLIFCIAFFITTLVETIFSPTLSNSLFSTFSKGGGSSIILWMLKLF